jgi:hypothetical protein
MHLLHVTRPRSHCVAGQGSCIVMASRYPKAYTSITSLCFAVDASDRSSSRHCKQVGPPACTLYDSYLEVHRQSISLLLCCSTPQENAQRQIVTERNAFCTRSRAY